MNFAAIRKDLRCRFRGAGWSLVFYYIMMNIIMVGAAVGVGMEQNNVSTAVINEATGFGYLISTIFGLFILIGRGQKGFMKSQVLAERRPMKPLSFFKILCVFLSVQFVSYFYNMIMEALLNSMGYSMYRYKELMQTDSDSLTMYLYMAISAPITEEILFRGLIMRTMRPYGRKFAIFTSAFLFGIFHGDWTQIPFAFTVGLILGYVAMEHHILWAMLLHMINNMFLADGLTRITSHMPSETSTLIFLGVVFAFAIAALIIMIVDRKKISAYLKPEPMNKLCVQAFFSCPSVITMTLLALFNAWMLIMPV